MFKVSLPSASSYNRTGWKQIMDTFALCRPWACDRRWKGMVFSDPSWCGWCGQDSNDRSFSPNWFVAPKDPFFQAISWEQQKSWGRI